MLPTGPCAMTLLDKPFDSQSGLSRGEPSTLSVSIDEGDMDDKEEDGPSGTSSRSRRKLPKVRGQTGFPLWSSISDDAMSRSTEGGRMIAASWLGYTCCYLFGCGGFSFKTSYSKHTNVSPSTSRRLAPVWVLGQGFQLHMNIGPDASNRMSL